MLIYIYTRICDVVFWCALDSSLGSNFVSTELSFNREVIRLPSSSAKSASGSGVAAPM